MTFWQWPVQFIKSFLEFLRFDRKFRVRKDLHHLLNELRDCDEFEKRVDWVIYFCAWLRLPHNLEIDTAMDISRIPSVRFKYVLHIIAKNTAMQARFFEVIQQTLMDMSDLDFFSEVGLSNQVGFIQELTERVMIKALPSTPLKHDLSSLIIKLFPDEEDLVWIDHLDEDILTQLMDLFLVHQTVPMTAVVYDLTDALIFLGSQIQSLALSSQFRKRLPYRHLKEMPFYNFGLILHEFTQSRREQDWSRLLVLQQSILQEIAKCHEALQDLHSHLDEHGVSLSMVFQMERLRRQLARVMIIVETLVQPKVSAVTFREFLLQLVHDVQSKRSLGSFLRDSLQLLTLKVVERNSEIGEHYITHTKKEYLSMFRKAGGGGFITAFTVFLKLGISSLGLPFFLAGFFASLNYSISFLAIQMAGFTLATKQPASTAPSIATKLRNLTPERLNEVTDEMMALLRTQLIGILGNLSLVVPTTLLIFYFFSTISGQNIISTEKAEYILNSTNLTGPSFVYGAFTGVLLFASSLAAGWFDNWVTFRKIKERIRYNEKIRNIFGRRQARAAANFIQKNAAALAANISLGFMLGLLPEILRFFGIPLEVRHITLSTGSLAVAVPALGYDIFLSWPFWNAFLGIIVIGALNLTVSFTLAFALALSAQKIRRQQRRSLLISLLQRITKNPLELFLPIGSS